MDALLFVPLGLLGLNLLVVIHELGHFWAARAVGVEVEAFAVGWGKILWKWKPGATEYRFCLFPLGGYCKMKGDKYLMQAIEGGALEGAPVTVQPEPGSFHAAAPWRRIVISLAGPLFNLILTFLLFVILQATGVPQRSLDSRIVVLDSASAPGQIFPAQEAGLKTGDWINSINGKAVRNFADVQAAIADSGESRIDMTVTRDGTARSFTLTPLWNPVHKTAMIGIQPWQVPLVSQVDPKGAGAIVGVLAGDRFLAVEGRPVVNTHELFLELRDRRSITNVTVERTGKAIVLSWVPVYRNGEPDLAYDLRFAEKNYPAEGKSLVVAVGEGFRLTGVALQQTTTALVRMFTGLVSVGDSLSGPIKISYLVGGTMSQVFSDDLWSGLTRLITVAAYLSLALFYMNLLPIPALDGGSIVLQLIEIVQRRPVSIRFFLRYQQVGGVFILLLILFTTFNDTGLLPK